MTPRVRQGRSPSTRSRDPERDADLGVEIKGRRHQADHDRHRGDDEKGQRTLERDDPAQNADGTPVSLSKLNGRLRSPNPAAMFTARLQAAMMRLATMITSVMSWIMARSRAVDGSSASIATGTPWKGKARSRVVRTRSSAPDDPSVATTMASTGSLAAFATDR